MSDPFIQLADDIALNLLQNEGVLFSESRQEIYVINTTATFIWLCMEDALPFEAIVAEYADVFDMPGQQAAESVLATLQEWQGMGYLWGVDYPNSKKIGFNTALGRLLTNPVLREAFANNPDEISQQINVNTTDYNAFMALDLAQVEVHSRLLITKKLSRRHAAQRNFEARRFYAYSNYIVSPLDSDAIEQRYQVLSTRFVLRFPPVEYASLIEGAFGHLRTDSSKEVDVQFELVQSNNKILLLENSEPTRDCGSISGVVPMINAALRQSVASRHPHFLNIHAGVVAGKKACMLLPGSSGSGKTTLTAGLSRTDYQYFSDEIALLVKAKELCVQPVPLPMTVKSGSVSVLANYYRDIANLPIHVREDNKEVRYLRPAIDSLPRKADCTMPVAAIVFPQFDAAARNRLDPIVKTRALSMLLEECMDIPELLTKEQISDLVAWIETVDCYELAFSDLEEAISLLQALDF